MTIGHLMEMIVGRHGAETGQTFKTQPFSKFDIKKEYFEVMYDPHTGRKIQTRIFMGVIVYQKLKHMVSDKMSARGGVGKYDIMSRQPVEGRSRGGGQRSGEMERDAMVAHGATAFLQDRLFFNSDPFEAPVCKRCGILARSEVLPCKWCKEKSDVAMIKMPYSFKLLLSELASMNNISRTK
jgi:DNA-directed RNA polymerase II subunit RPB2